ncbi:MAG: hypothetical protein C4325_04190, partial [Blastocatellia bacterium]
MPFVFANRFYYLLIAGILPLGFVSAVPAIGYAVLLYDFCLTAFAIYDYRKSRHRIQRLLAERTFDERFAIGSPSTVRIAVENLNNVRATIELKDEIPPEMELEGSREATIPLASMARAEFTYRLRPPRRGEFHFGKIAVRLLSDFRLVMIDGSLATPEVIKVYPNIRRARQMEQKSLGSRSFLAVKRRAEQRGEGRDFESLRDYVRGDELRHISWPATARRSKLTTRQFQIERDQTVIIALDAGRLMTGRIDGETKFDAAVHSALALMSAAQKAGDNCGLLVFCRRVLRFVPPKRAGAAIDSVIEALCTVEPELIEPSYPRALQFIASNVKRRSCVVILTDLVDQDSSRDLIRSLRLLRPRHLP